MSEVMKMINVHDTGVRVATLGGVDFTTKVGVVDVPPMYNYASNSYVYKASVEIAAQFVNEGHNNDFDTQVKIAKRRIAEVLFGVYRKALIEIQAAAYDRNFQKVADLSEFIIKDMFEDF
jgi:hypothetical protein